MELKIKLEELHNRVDGLKDKITTEEATKNAFIMPFIQILGYDIFNPVEVVPEYTTDVGTKKGEKIDYVIQKEGEPIIIIECKHWKENLDAHNSQLHRYYNVSKSRFGVITNGIIYNFYADLEAPNVMDTKPFLTINMEDLRDSSVKELEKFSKSSFDLTNILDSAEALKYVKAIKKEFEKEVNNPTDEFIKLLVARFFDRPITATRLSMFNDYASKAINSYLNERISDRLKSALKINDAPVQQGKNIESSTTSVDDNSENSKIDTTIEELEAFQIVKAIMREVVSADRIHYRDGQAYFSIILDDNNRRPLCRIYLNPKTKYIELFNEGKDAGKKISLESIDDIYQYKNELQKTVENY